MNTLLISLLRDLTLSCAFRFRHLNLASDSWVLHDSGIQCDNELWTIEVDNKSIVSKHETADAILLEPLVLLIFSLKFMTRNSDYTNIACKSKQYNTIQKQNTNRRNVFFVFVVHILWIFCAFFLWEQSLFIKRLFNSFTSIEVLEVIRSVQSAKYVMFAFRRRKSMSVRNKCRISSRSTLISLILVIFKGNANVKKLLC